MKICHKVFQSVRPRKSTDKNKPLGSCQIFPLFKPTHPSLKLWISNISIAPYCANMYQPIQANIELYDKIGSFDWQSICRTFKGFSMF